MTTPTYQQVKCSKTTSASGSGLGPTAILSKSDFLSPSFSK